MKSFPKLLFTFTFLLFTLLCNAQWYKLPAYTNPFISDSSLYWHGGAGSYPVSPLAAGNGVIVYAGEAQPIEFMGTEMAIEESTNDLFYCANLYSNNNIGGFPEGLISKNESTYCFINLPWASAVELFYTSDNFATITNISTLHVPGFSINIPDCFSNNFIYLAWDSLPDTLIIYRNYPILSSTKKYFNSKYKNPVHLYFTSDSVGYMICGYANNAAKSVLAKTVDSGATWSDSFLDSLHVITACSFPSANVGYLTENNGNIYKTYNAGGTWVQLSSPTSNQLRCISFSNNLLGLIGGTAGVLYRTTDGGASWSSQTSNDTYSINSLFTFDSVAYFIDSQSNIYKNQNFTGIEGINELTSIVKVYPNPNNGQFSLVIANLVKQSYPIMEIYNVLGERVYKATLQQVQGDNSINLSNQANGVYLYRIISESGDLIGEGKLVIQK